MVSIRRNRIVKILAVNLLLQRLRKRKYWVHPLNRNRKMDGEHLKIDEMYTKYPDRFFQYTRMTPIMFDKLLGIIGPSLMRRNTRFRESVSSRIRLYVLLRYLATGDNLRTIATNFSIGVSTVWTILTNGLPCLWSKLRNPYVKSPTGNEWADIANEYQRKWNYPHCVGALDGKHVVINAPRKSGSLYLNYKGSFSIVLLATCDASYKFTTVDVGGYGKQSDGGVFIRSQLGQKLINGTLDIPSPTMISNYDRTVPYHFIGDEAFPLAMYMMRPFPGATLTNERRIFNYRLSRARRCIENAFGIMASRFRIFRRPINATPKSAENVVLAAVALHNFIIIEENSLPEEDRMYIPPGFADRNDGREGHWRTDGSSFALNEIPQLTIAAHERLAKKMRDDLVHYFNNAGRVDWQDERAGIIL